MTELIFFLHMPPSRKHFSHVAPILFCSEQNDPKYIDVPSPTSFQCLKKWLKLSWCISELALLLIVNILNQYCLPFPISLPSILLKIVLIKGDSAASVWDSAAWIMKRQETHIQSRGKSVHTHFLSHRTQTHIEYVADVKTVIGIKSFDLWPHLWIIENILNTWVQPRRRPINSRQFRSRVEVVSERLMISLYRHFTTFCSISLIACLSSHLLPFAISPVCVFHALLLPLSAVVFVSTNLCI